MNRSSTPKIVKTLTAKNRRVLVCTPGGVVEINAELHSHDGRAVVRVELMPKDGWHTDGFNGPAAARDGYADRFIQNVEETD